MREVLACKEGCEYAVVDDVFRMVLGECHDAHVTNRGPLANLSEELKVIVEVYVAFPVAQPD